MNRLLLVDGSNLLFQMFYGMPARITNAQGRPIHGTLGFVGALLKMIRMTEPTHLAVLFDGEHENSRTAIDKSYKANRPDFSQADEADTPFSQLPDLFLALDYLGIRHAETDGCETDDWIAAYALRRDAHTEVIIASHDSDFFQLLSDHVSVLRYRGKQSVIWTPESLLARFGIQPCQYADFKSLTGDPSDNIRGAEKIGPKTAAGLLNAFGTLEGVIGHMEQIQKPSIRQSIAQNAQRLGHNQRLIRLSAQADPPFPMDFLAYRHAGQTTSEVMRAIGLS